VWLPALLVDHDRYRFFKLFGSVAARSLTVSPWTTQNASRVAC
jgi:hypothetical protein